MEPNSNQSVWLKFGLLTTVSHSARKEDLFQEAFTKLSKAVSSKYPQHWPTVTLKFKVYRNVTATDRQISLITHIVWLYS